MKTTKWMACLIGTMVASCALHADQVWTNTAGGEWNTVGNWLPGVVPPGATDTAFLTNRTISYTVDYNTPMAAASIFALTNANAAGNVTTLNINTNGFNVTGTNLRLFFLGPNSVLNLNTGGVLTINGGTSASVEGGILNINGGVMTNVTTGTGGLDVGYSGGSKGTVNMNSGMFWDGNKGIVLGSGNYQGGSVLNVNGGFMKVDSTLNVGRFGLSNTLNMTGGLLQVAGSGSINVANTGGQGVMTLSGGTITNNGVTTIGGAGGLSGVVTQSGGLWYQGANARTFIGNAANSTGIFNLVGGTFITAAGSTPAHVIVGVVSNGVGVLTVGGGTLTATNTAQSTALEVRYGTFNLTNGTVTVDLLVATNSGTVNYSGGALNTKSALIGAGSSFTVTNHGNAQISGLFTNLGTVRVVNSVATFQSNVVVGGAYLSDPSTNIVAGALTVMSSGSLSGSNGDLFVLYRDFNNSSTNRTQFDLSRSAVFFTNGAGGTTHTLNLTNSTALDWGGGSSVAQFATNFAIGTLSIALSNQVTLTGVKSGATTNALYVGWLDLSAWTTNAAGLTNTLQAALTLNDINLYYDPNDTRNAYLQDASYDIWGGGLLIPIPEPSALMLTLGAGAFSMFILRRKGGRR